MQNRAILSRQCAEAAKQANSTSGMIGTMVTMQRQGYTIEIGRRRWKNWRKCNEELHNNDVGLQRLF